MKKFLLISITLGVAGCLTMSGNYTVSGYDSHGKELTGNLKLTAHGRQIYTARNAICSLHPNATVIIKDSLTGEELKSESPYQCSNTKSKNRENSNSSTDEISSTESTLTNGSNIISDKSNPQERKNNQQRRVSSSSDGVIEEDLESSSNGSSTSRLRLFGQNGAGVVLYRNSHCVKNSLGKEDERVSGGLGSAFGSLLGTVSNTSIGIPQTDTTRNLKKKNGLLSKAYFREYELASNKPVTVVMGFQDVSSFYEANGIHYSEISSSCKGAIQFVPRAGTDYEASFRWPEGSVCVLGINRISQKDGVTTLKPVEVHRAQVCG